MSPDDQQDDPTRKQRREQARADRKALEEAEAMGAVRRKRLTVLGSSLAVVIVAIVVILVATGGGGSTKVTGKGTSPEEKSAIEAVEGTLSGTAQSANVLGSATAPVTLQYFGDLECPICRDFTLGALPDIIQKWVASGKLRIEYRSLETATREPEVFKTQQVAALAAGKQNLMWWYIELFYHEQGEEDSGYVNEEYLDGIAKQVPGLNLTKWKSERADAAFSKQVEEDAAAANREGFNGTPSFLIGRTGGALKKLESSEYGTLTEAGGFDKVIEALVKD